MKLLKRLKARYLHPVERKYVKTIARRQLNFACNENLVLAITGLSRLLKVPKYVIAEHALQVGLQETFEDVIQGAEQRETLTEHLVKIHLLGEEVVDDDEVLGLEERTGSSAGAQGESGDDVED